MPTVASAGAAVRVSRNAVGPYQLGCDPPEYLGPARAIVVRALSVIVEQRLRE
jgi:hypothetical protein